MIIVLQSAVADTTQVVLFAPSCFTATLRAEVLMMEFPYGICNFEAIIEDNMFYVDRTHLIPTVERAGHQLIFLRPHRFGK